MYPGAVVPLPLREVVRAGVRLALPLCHDHVVVGQVCQQRHALAVWAPAPHRRIGVAACARGSSLLGVRGRIPRLQGLSPSVIEQILISSKLLLLLFQASRSGD